MRGKPTARKGLLLFFSLLLLFSLLPNWLGNLPALRGGLRSEQPSQSMTSGVISKDSLVHTQTYYQLCSHLREEETIAEAAWQDQDAVGLAKLGWTLLWQQGEAYLYREEDALCPADAQKRHIRIVEGGIGVFLGPSNAQGAALETIPVSPEMLYRDWQLELQQGGIDFADEEALAAALDTIDELLNAAQVL